MPASRQTCRSQAASRLWPDRRCSCTRAGARQGHSSGAASARSLVSQAITSRSTSCLPRSRRRRLRAMGRFSGHRATHVWRGPISTSSLPCSAPRHQACAAIRARSRPTASLPGRMRPGRRFWPICGSCSPLRAREASSRCSNSAVRSGARAGWQEIFPRRCTSPSCATRSRNSSRRSTSSRRTAIPISCSCLCSCWHATPGMSRSLRCCGTSRWICRRTRRTRTGQGRGRRSLTNCGAPSRRNYRGFVAFWLFTMLGIPETVDAIIDADLLAASADYQAECAAELPG